MCHLDGAVVVELNLLSLSLILHQDRSWVLLELFKYQCRSPSKVIIPGLMLPYIRTITMSPTQYGLQTDIGSVHPLLCCEGKKNLIYCLFEV